MRVSPSGLVAIFAYTPTVIAAPANICNPVDAVYAILKGPLKAQASSLCLSFLGGNKVVTQYQTQTVAGATRVVTITQPDETQQATADVTSVVQITLTAIEQQPDVVQTQIVTVTAATRTVYQKRQTNAAERLQERGIPPQLKYFAEQRISSACKCIVTPTTRTVFATRTSNVPGPQNTQTQAGRTVIVTITRTVQVTSEDTVTKTLPPANTVVQTIYTSVTPVLIKPKICNARGLPGANAFNYDANFNTNQANCISSCQTDNRCLSTGFYMVTNPSTGTSSGTCRKYDKSVTDSADLGSGYYNFNDKACPAVV